MKNICISIIFFLQLASPCVADQPLPHQGSRGVGEHFFYDPGQWDGKEQVVTKLIKGNETILFVRISKGEFEVRRELPSREGFFRFSSTREAKSPGLNWAVMVDFVQAGDMAAVLMLGDRGYYYVRSSTTPLKLKPPLHFLPAAVLTAGKWIPICSVGPGDFYYPEAHGGVEGEIAKARLKTINEIEFERLSQNGNIGRKNVFTVKEDQLLKDDLKVEETVGLLGIRMLWRIDERSFAKILQEGVQNKDIRASFVGYSKDDILKVISEFEDKDLSESIKKKITAALAE